jgi:hypothetical protein
MNALIREKYEVPVSTNEAIEVHLTYLRNGFDSLAARIEAVNKSLSEKIDKANEQRSAGDAALSVKMDKLTEKVLANEGHHKTVLWVVSLAAVIASLASIARTFNWI